MVFEIFYSFLQYIALCREVSLNSLDIVEAFCHPENCVHAPIAGVKSDNSPWAYYPQNGVKARLWGLHCQVIIMSARLELFLNHDNWDVISHTAEVVKAMLNEFYCMYFETECLFYNIWKKVFIEGPILGVRGGRENCNVSLSFINIFSPWGVEKLAPARA